MAEKPKYPAEFPISRRVTAFVGYKNGKVRIAVQTGIPLVGTVNLWLERDDMPHIERIIAAQKEWMAKPELERFLKGADE